MRRYLLAALVVVWGVVLIGGCSDGTTGGRRHDDGGTVQSQADDLGADAAVPRLRVSVELGATPTPTPSPLVPDVPRATAPVPTEAAERSLGLAPGAGAVSPVTPAPVADVSGPATLVSGVTLTIYSCLGDSTGAYCPGGSAMAGGEQVHRGAVACGYAWELGQRLRILGDPLEDMIYTCKDRGGGLAWLHVDVWFYDYWGEGRPWRDMLPQPVTVELLN